MKTVSVKVSDISSGKEAIEAAGSILRAGGLVAIPTETVYGLAANALDSDAVRKVFEAKGRPCDNPLIVHVADVSEVESLVEKVDPRFYLLAERFWPGPLTVIMKKSPIVPDATSGNLDTVAIRMPSNPIANAVIKAAGVPLAAPSANSSGKPSPTKAQHVLDDLDGKIEMVIDGGSCEIGVESTVITLVGERPALLRPGGVTPEELREVLGDIEIDSAVFSKLEEGKKAASPGMKYKHYSPKATVTIIKGSLEKVADYVNGKTENRCVLGFSGEGQVFDCPFMEYGARGDSLSQAAMLFDCLRRVDDEGYGNVYVMCPETQGVGLAVYNRLLRSAAFRVIDVERKLPVIGLTGPTGAGKSTVCEYLAQQGFYIIDGDVLARQAVCNKTVLEDLAAQFGADIILPDGTLDRAKTAERAFATPEGTAALNRITHPAITALTSMELEKAAASEAGGAVIDAAALLESPIVKLCTFTACVIAPENERLQRIISRDSISEEAALRRMRAQRTAEDYAANTDFTINNGTGDDFREDLKALINACDKIKNGKEN